MCGGNENVSDSRLPKKYWGQGTREDVLDSKSKLGPCSHLWGHSPRIQELKKLRRKSLHGNVAWATS